MQDLLFLVHRIPYPPNKGDKVRSFHLLKHLAQKYRIFLAAFIDDEADEKYVADVKALCAECFFVRLDPRLARLRSLRGLLDGRPLTLCYFQNDALARWVDETVQKQRLRHALVFSSSMGQYIEHFAALNTVVDFVDVDSEKWRQYAASRRYPMKWIYQREGAKLLDYERQLVTSARAGVFVSPQETALFRRLAPEAASKVHAIVNGVDTAYFSPQQEYANPYQSAGNRVLVFTGAMDYWANVDAVIWFAANAWPEIRAKVTDAQFFIVGARPTAEVRALERTPGINVTGTVADIRPYLAHATAAVAPLRIARGIQNKVLEAMAMARPVVASPGAAEGINAVPGRELLVAEDAIVFAAACIELLQHGDETGVGAAGRERVVQDFNWTRNLSRFEDLLRDVS